MKRTTLVGLISDTHGMLDPRVLDAFAGVAHIVHAGDIGDMELLTELETIAPVTAVRGNTDGGQLPWLEAIENIQIAGCKIRVLHDLSESAGTIPRDALVVVSGHTHVARVSRRAGVLFVNPGSASEPRARKGASVAILEIGAAGVDARIVEL